MPPSPVVICLFGVEGEHRRVPARADRDAVGVRAPSASQASSTIGRPEPLERGDRRPASRRCAPAAAPSCAGRPPPRPPPGRSSACAGRCRRTPAARARRRSTLAEATNENGLVMTSSPSPTPTARSARCSPAVPLETALACGAPMRCAKRRSNSPSSGPSESRPERSTSTTAALLRLAEHRPRERDLLRVAHAGGPESMPRSSESTSASQEAATTFSETPIEPHTALPSEESSSTRVTAPVPLSSSRMRTLKLTSSMSARCGWTSPIAARSARVERVDRAVALGGAHAALAADPDLDRRLASGPRRRRAARRSRARTRA